MNITLILTASNCFRPPAVIERVLERLANKNTVAMATRDHADTLPDNPSFTALAADDWECLLRQPRALTVLDNLRFRDARGEEFERWSETGWETRPRGTLEHLIKDLSAATASLMLVSADAGVSGAWRAWCEQREIRIEQHAGHPARHWSLEEGLPRGERGTEDGVIVNLFENALQKRLDPVHDVPRRFKCEVVDPEQEILLALMAEFTAMRYDYRNPADPLWLNARDDGLREIIAGCARHAKPGRLLEAMESLYDVLSEYTDFSKLIRDTSLKHDSRARP